jgi:hypothetical protein
MNIIGIDVGLFHLSLLYSSFPKTFEEYSKEPDKLFIYTDNRSDHEKDGSHLDTKLTYTSDAIDPKKLPNLTNYVFAKEYIKKCELIDIKDLTLRCNDQDCNLNHEKLIADYMRHLFKTYKKDFDSADYIAVEKQPPTGFIAIEQIIMYEYRHKTILVYPMAMLKYLGILHLEYEERKVCTEKFADYFISDFNNYKLNERKHDMADAVCILYFFVYKTLYSMYSSKKNNQQHSLSNNQRNKFSQYNYVHNIWIQDQIQDITDNISDIINVPDHLESDHLESDHVESDHVKSDHEDFNDQDQNNLLDFKEINMNNIFSRFRYDPARQS